MITQDMNELAGWHRPSREEHEYIKDELLPLYKKGVHSRDFWGIAMAVTGVLLICGIALQAVDRTFGLGAVIFFGTIALLTFISGISLLVRSRTERTRAGCVKNGMYSVLECMCVDTEHPVEGSGVSFIRVRSMSGQECGQWLRAPRNLARSFDALAQKTGKAIPELAVIIVRLDFVTEYHILPKK